MTDKIDTVTGRRKLDPRRSPYWMAIPDVDGAYIGFRRGPDTWICRLRDTDMAGGQQYQALGRFEDHRSAIRAAKDWITARQQGVTDHDATVGDACRAYLSNLEQEKGPSAAQEARARLQRRVLGRTKEEARKARARPLEAHKLARKPLAKLRSTDVEAWRDELIPEGLAGEARRKARASANREMTALVAALNHAHRRQLVATDTAWATVGKFPDVQARKARDFVSVDQRKKLLDAASRVGTGAVKNLLEGLMLTGARPIELARATVADYDVKAGTLSLVSFKGRSSEPRRREIPLLALGAESLVKKLCKNKLPGAFIFTRDDGHPWGHSDWDQLVRLACSSANLSRVTAYSLRHAFISEALAGGVDVHTVSKIVGTSLQQMSVTYGKLIEPHAAKAFKGIRLV